MIVALRVGFAGTASFILFIAALSASAWEHTGNALARDAAFRAVAENAVVAVVVCHTGRAGVSIFVTGLLGGTRRGLVYASAVHTLLDPVAE